MMVSQAGKAMLLQYVAQSIPIFSMRCFKLANTFLDELNALMVQL